LIVHRFPWHGGTKYGPGSTRERIGVVSLVGQHMAGFAGTLEQTEPEPPVIDPPGSRLVLGNKGLNRRPLRIVMPEQTARLASLSFRTSESRFAQLFRPSDWVSTLKRFQEKLHEFSTSKARPDKDLDHFIVSGETWNDLKPYATWPAAQPEAQAHWKL
jgi:hypothetical protein